MEISLKQTSYTLSHHERQYLDEKLSAIADRVQDDPAALCEVEIEKDTHHWKGDDVFYAEVNVTYHGKLYRATAREATPQAAMDAVKDEMLRLLTKGKRRHLDAVRRGARKAKEIVRKLWR
ncbi:hypothetical protein D6792_00375 [Candidatus Parcubacteria bacterium]|jgi:ribosome-associated translation inhibitor RaiA|nr:MAG: hypothetical protein D6792_00375 [Candidatus Parcubacteria bacterium]